MRPTRTKREVGVPGTMGGGGLRYYGCHAFDGGGHRLDARLGYPGEDEYIGALGEAGCRRRGGDEDPHRGVPVFDCLRL